MPRDAQRLPGSVRCPAGPLPRLAAFALGCLLLAGAAPAAAAGAEASATTFFSTRPYSLDGAARAESAFYEALSLLTAPTTTGAFEDLRLVVHGWGKVVAGDPRDGNRGTGDLDALYLETRLLKKHATLRVGRQLLSSGGARNVQLDGADLIAFSEDLSIGLEVFGGAPVLPRATFNQSNFLGGGRLFWRHLFDGEMGLSFVQAVQDGVKSRQDLSFDAWWRALERLTVAVNIDFNLYEQRLQEGRIFAVYQPFKIFQVSIDVQRTSPDLFLSRASIFSVFSAERRDEVGGEVTIRTSPKFTHTIEAHWTHNESGAGYHAGTKGVWRPFTFVPTTVGGELRILHDQTNGFVQLRSFLIQKLMYDVNFTGEFDLVWIENPVNGRVRTAIAQASLGRRFGERWDAMAAMSVGDTAYLDRRTELTARLTYRFGPGGQ